MTKPIRRFYFLAFLAFSATNLTGCAVAVIGAAAGAATIEKNNTANEPNNKENGIRQNTDADESKALNIESAPLEQNALIPEPASIKKEPPAKASVNNTSIANLIAHPWRIKPINTEQESIFSFENSILSFSKDYKFKALLSCNYISGRFDADDNGNFIIKKLYSSNRSCFDSSRQEALLKSKLLLADEFFISRQTLVLGTKGSTTLAFVETNSSIDTKEFESLKLEKRKYFSRRNKVKEKAKSKNLGRQ